MPLSCNPSGSRKGLSLPMQFGLPALLVSLACGQCPQPSYQTANFVVQADTIEVAKVVADAAERCRRDLAKAWLERDLPAWPSPCQIHVTVDLNGTAGRTDVSFCGGKVISQAIDVRGPLKRVLQGALPHELTHVLFAHYFSAQPPRWADEGGAILSEDGVQGERQRKLFRKIQSEDRCFSLRRLLGMHAYPEDVSCLYAQGHSLSRFLVAAKSRKAFLTFVSDGQDRGWDQAVRDQYGYDDIEHLEQAWLGWVAKQGESRTASFIADECAHAMIQ